MPYTQHIHNVYIRLYVYRYSNEYKMEHEVSKGRM
jgi:hypothetical protein